MCANSEGSGETAHPRSRTRAFADQLCDKYHNLISWFIYSNEYPQHMQVRQRFIFIAHFEMFKFTDFLQIYRMMSINLQT